VKISVLAAKYKLVSKTLDLNKDNVDSYMAALEATIVNQTSLRDAKKLKLPIHILRGTLEPVVVNRNLKELAKVNKHVTLKNVVASHEVYGLFVPAVVKAIRETIESK
jgi:alpha-beta hydrolase superfamily lysophospholipase